MNTLKSIIHNKILRVCLLLLIITYPFYKDFGFIFSVGDSMLPTYENGELIVIHKITSLGPDWSPQVGQVVVAIDPEDGGRVTKRVIALEGDHVIIKHGRIYVNDKRYEDSYTHQNITFWTEDEETRSKKPESEWLFYNVYEDVGIIPKGHVWVIGDNRNMSWMGKVKIKDIEGLVLF